MALVDTFCRCVKKLNRTLKSKTAATAICTRSVLGKRRKTLREYSCGLKGKVRYLKTQKLIKKKKR